MTPTAVLPGAAAGAGGGSTLRVAVAWRGGPLAGLAGAVVLLVAARWLRRRFVVADVHGPSMAPTLVAGDRVLVRTVHPGRIRAGDIVVLERATLDSAWLLPPASGGWSRREWLIKRVAATAGDPVPAAVVPAVAAALGPAGAVVPPGQLVVLGDNAAQSVDSRHYGWLPADRVLGVLHRRLPRPAPARDAGPPREGWQRAARCLAFRAWDGT